MYYTAEHLVEKAKQAEGFIEIPDGYWLCFVRRTNTEGTPGKFNDVVNVMHKEEIVLTSTCTTTPGMPALKGGYRKYNKLGVAVVKANIWMNKAFSFGKHNGRMDALRQVKPVFVHRDGDKDNIAEELGTAKRGMWHTNIHAATYNTLDKIIKIFIRSWSYGCMVWNYRPDYNRMINFTRGQKFTSAIILDEFSI